MYTIPTSLKQEIDAFKQHITDFKSGNIEAVKFKAIRVPMGIYEQRINDSFMVRIRCAAGMIAPEQLKGITQLADNHAVGPIHITTRQELQLHNVKLEQTTDILTDLYNLGLATRGGGGNTVRNIMASENAGIAPDEKFDVTPYALALTNVLIAEPDSWTLPRKYKISFSGNDDDNANALFNDLGFIATFKNGQKGFKVFLGGGLGTKPSAGHLLFDFIPAGDILYVGEAVKLLFSEHGNRRNRHKARIRYIFYKLGKDKVFELFHGYFERLKKEGNYPLSLPKISLSTNQGSEPENGKGDDAYLLWKKRYVKPQRQEGLFTAEIPLEHGITDSKTLSALAEFLIPFGEDCLRLTMRQNILLRNIPGKELSPLYEHITSLGVETDVPRILNNLVACTGADTCRLGLCLAKGASSAIKSALSKIDATILDRNSDFRINLSGCPNSCGQHNIYPIGFYGKVSRNDRLYPAYYVTIGGRTGADKAQLGERIGEISARDLPAFSVKVINTYTRERDNYPDFYSYLQDKGKTEIENILASYNPIPSFEEDKNYYFDWGATELFSVKGKGTAECSAGMFDMIDFDRDTILNQIEMLKRIPATDAANSILYRIVFHASRMLLVTRGIEPKNREEVFDAFLAHFIHQGHLDTRFAEVVQHVRQNPGGQFREVQDIIIELASKVIDLYDNMDDSLQFKNNDSKPVPITADFNELKIIRNKDFRGVACPMNFVKTKIELSQMKKGELLQILLDDGEPVNNVPGSVRSDGHEILKVEKINHYWAVLIKK